MFCEYMFFLLNTCFLVLMTTCLSDHLRYENSALLTEESWWIMLRFIYSYNAQLCQQHTGSSTHFRKSFFQRRISHNPNDHKPGEQDDDVEPEYGFGHMQLF